MLHESIFTEVTVTGITTYGLALLFIKALIILLLAQTLSDQFEYSPASIRHSIWLLALASLAAIPLLTIMLPAWRLLSIELPAIATMPALGNDSTGTADISNTAVLSGLDWLAIVYLVVVISRIAYLFLEILKVASITAKATNADQCWYQQAQAYCDRAIVIKIGSAVDGPVTWGVLYPVILLPHGCGQWNPLEREMVLRHELGHIQRRDWLAQLLGQLVAVLYWPVPGAAKALRELSLEAERACDDLVLGDGVSPADYAALLLRQARVNTLQATVALGKPSELAQRVRHIVSAYVDRAGERNTRRWLAIAVGLLMLPFASIQAVGSFSSSGFLRDMVLIPVVIAPPEQIPAIPTNDLYDITRPVRPIIETEQVAAPRAVQSISVTEVVAVDTVVPMVKVAMLADMAIPALSVSQPRLLARQQPEYPSLARRRGIEGRVVVEFDIDAQGLVVNPRITVASTSNLLNRSVLQALSGYRFEPYRVDGEAIGMQGLREEFRFQLTEDKPTKRSANGDTRAGEQPVIDTS